MKLISCRALAHLIEPMATGITEQIILPISLHLNPEKLRNSLIEEIAKIEGKGCDIILGYGLCGRGLEGVYAGKSRLILPKVDDCICAVLGSRQRHQSIVKDKAGSFFLEPAWLDTDIDIFAQSLKGLDRIPVKYRDKIALMALKHYSTLVFIHHDKSSDRPAMSRCKKLAEQYRLEFELHLSDLSLLYKLVHGPWKPSEFIITEPGQAIPFF